MTRMLTSRHDKSLLTQPKFFYAHFTTNPMHSKNMKLLSAKRRVLTKLQQPPWSHRLLSSSSISLIVLFTYLFGQLTLAHGAYPCPYSQSVNISDGLRLKDGSYSFDGLVIPANLTAIYDIKVIDGIEYSAPKHMRGCACLLKPCIIFCCDPKMHYDEIHKNCTLNSKIEHSQHTHIEVTLHNGSVKIVNIHDSFLVRYELGCQDKKIDKKRAEFWKWDLFENGTLKRDNKLFNTDEYCFTPLEHKKTWSLTPLTCERFKKGFRVWIYALCTTVAIIINTGIILMFVAIKDVRNSNYGEGLIFHLVSLTFGLGFLVYLHLNNPMNLSHTACRNIGYLAYFFLLVSFLILNIISANFWATFSLKVIRSWYLKIMYGLTVVLGLIMKYLVKAVQDSSVGRHLKPGIGEDFCWFDMRLWGVMLFLYVPVMISLGLSMFCSARAYFSIFHLPNDTTTVAGKDFHTTKKHFRCYSIYLLVLFSIWMREIIVYITARIREHFFIIDYWSGISMLALAGVGFIFLLYRNIFFQKWWSVNVTGNELDRSLPPDFSYHHARESKRNDTENKAEGHKLDEIYFKKISKSDNVNKQKGQLNEM